MEFLKVGDEYFPLSSLVSIYVDADTVILYVTDSHRNEIPVTDPLDQGRIKRFLGTRIYGVSPTGAF